MKILYIGNFGKNGIISGGQVGKTINIYNLLKQKYNNINCVDLANWKVKPISIIIKIIIKNKQNDVCFAVLAQNSILYLLPILVFMKKVSKKKLLLYVVGGSLPSDIKKYNIIKKNIKKCDYIFVQTKTMINHLLIQGINNSVYTPSFPTRKYPNKILEKYDVKKSKGYKVFCFSRICKEKGISDAINTISQINSQSSIKITLDIYGIIDENYKKEFNKLLFINSKCVKYCGYYNSDSVDSLKNYFIYIFPTHHFGEGFPTTILESMMAGVPVIATNWMYNSEIVEHGKTGYIYNNNKKDALKETLIYAINNCDTYEKMRRNAFEKSKQYSCYNILNTFIKCIE